MLDNLSLEIRNKRVSRKKAIKIIKSDGLNPPLKDIKRFCSYCNISTKKFYEIAEKFRNKTIWKKNKNKKFYIKDFLIEDWSW